MTPLYKINLHGSNPLVGPGQVWAKLENRNPTGSHKDRSMKPWVLHYAKSGVKELAISSSGNSAISAAKYCGGMGIKLNVFMSPHADTQKIELLKSNKDIIFDITKTPNKDAFRFCKKNNIINLRASRDDNALIGYEEIARELKEQLPNIDNIFIPTSSGATLEGIYQGFAKKGVKSPALYAIQTTKVHPIASYFDKNFTKESTSRATAIVDSIARRRDGVIKIIKETRGGGFVISNKELEEARQILKRNNPDLRVKWHSILSFAGFLKWQITCSNKLNDAITACLFTD